MEFFVFLLSFASFYIFGKIMYLLGYHYGRLYALTKVCDDLSETVLEDK